MEGQDAGTEPAGSVQRKERCRANRTPACTDSERHLKPDCDGKQLSHLEGSAAAACISQRMVF